MSFYEEWSEDLAADLAEPFPPEAHQTKKQGGSEITFVGWPHYVARLNDTVGPNGWQTRVRLEEHGGKLVAIVSLSVLGVTKENVGDEDEDKDSYGTASTNSYAQALKRAAAGFGLGLYLYDKGAREQASRAPSTPKQQARQQSNGAGKQPWEKLMPFGKTKGTPLGDHTEEQLRKLLDWCQEDDEKAKKFAELIADLEATLKAGGKTV
jgi:hypothetical protein